MGTSVAEDYNDFGLGQKPYVCPTSLSNPSPRRKWYKYMFERDPPLGFGRRLGHDPQLNHHQHKQEHVHSAVDTHMSPSGKSSNR